jgi:hypothetical protein
VRATSAHVLSHTVSSTPLLTAGVERPLTKERPQQQIFNVLRPIPNIRAIVSKILPFVPTSNPARQGQLDLMYAYYKNREPESAIDQADQFIRENPAHPRVDYAYYIKGLTQFERNPNFLERWFNADLTERPPIDARKSFQAFPDDPREISE